MFIVGINAFHGDSAAAVVSQGRVVAAAEEERFTRVKHWAGLPVESIRYCLDEAGIEARDVSCFAVNADSRAHRMKKLAYVLGQAPSPRLLVEKLATRHRRQSVLASLGEALDFNTKTSQLVAVEHHRAHLASAYYPSGFDRAAVVSVDGFGDFSSGAWGRGESGRLTVTGYRHFPHSLGLFYQALTQYLGFPAYGDEYKVMGLAAYSDPGCLAELASVLVIEPDGSYRLDLDCFRHHRERIAHRWTGGRPEFSTLYTPELEARLGPARRPDDPITDRHRSIAAGVQRLYEDALMALLESIRQACGTTNLALAGGCGMNSVANGKIRQRTGFRNIYIQAAAGDAGGAIGAALEAWRDRVGELPADTMPHAYLGPSYDSAAIRSALREREAELAAAGCRVDSLSEADLLDRVAIGLSAGRVTGWFQGRMEWGPRALGNRSILADPRNPDMKRILNDKIKRRESFRPFAPSVLRERVTDWFEEDDDVPFMQKVYRVRPDRAEEIPAVVHVDGTGRLQTVHRHSNSRFHALIEAFGRLTGVPLLLNTSFNENEPIVRTPDEALDCFLRTRMDALALGDCLITRKQE